jgi:hypothetical protein
MGDAARAAAPLQQRRAMPDMTYPPYQFEELRSLLQLQPSAEVWKALCALVDGPAWDEAEEEWLPYAASYLDRHWPDSLRRLPHKWWSYPIVPQAISLARNADITYDFTPDMLDAAGHNPPQLTHIYILPFPSMVTTLEHWRPCLAPQLSWLKFRIPWTKNGFFDINEDPTIFERALHFFGAYSPPKVFFSEHYDEHPELAFDERRIEALASAFSDHVEQLGMVVVTPASLRVMASVAWPKLRVLYLLIYDPDHPDSFEHPQTLCHGYKRGTHRLPNAFERELLRGATAAVIMPRQSDKRYEGYTDLVGYP